jgi:hypothetical protein
LDHTREGNLGAKLLAGLRGCVEREVLQENEQRGPLRKAATLGELTVSLLTRLWAGVGAAGASSA